MGVSTQCRVDHMNLTRFANHLAWSMTRTTT